MKKLLLGLAVVALCSSGNMFAGSGDAAAGLIGGTAFGLIAGQAMRPREKTVYTDRQAPATADYSRAEMDRLREDIRALKGDLNALERENDELRDENREQRKLIFDLQKARQARR